jgi:hypothetical protein
MMKFIATTIKTIMMMTGIIMTGVLIAGGRTKLKVQS